MSGTRQDRWDGRFMALAHLVSTWSKDPDRRVGAVLVSPDMRSFSPGYNGLPRGVEDTFARLHDKELKNAMTVHAERNALDNADFDPRGCALYVTCFPCCECAKGIIQTGVSVVVAPAPDLGHRRWGESQRLSCIMFQEAGVSVRCWEGGAS
jgi:dCMP deaminase